MFVRPYFCTDQFLLLLLLLLSFFIINLYLLRHNVCSIFFAFVFCFVVVARFLSDQVMLATRRHIDTGHYDTFCSFCSIIPLSYFCCCCCCFLVHCRNRSLLEQNAIAVLITSFLVNTHTPVHTHRFAL